MAQVEYVTDPSLYFDMLTSNRQKVTDVKLVTDEMVEMRWRNKEEFVESSGRTNVMFAAYIPPHKLKIVQLQFGPRTTCMYGDTDYNVYCEKNSK